MINTIHRPVTCVSGSPATDTAHPASLVQDYIIPGVASPAHASLYGNASPTDINTFRLTVRR